MEINSPLIRFKDYVKEWKYFPLKDVLKVNSGRDYKHLSVGNIPVYGTGGYMLSVNSALSEQDAVGIGRKGTIDKPQLLKAPFWTVDTLFFMTPRENNNLFFLYTILQKINWKSHDESSGVPSLSKLNIEKINLNLPEVEEQKKIGEFFKNLDDSISIRQQELETLKQTKQGFLQKMFPKEGARVPEVRFAGFNGKWNERRLDSIFGKIRNAFVGTATPYYVEKGNFYLESNNVKDGKINKNSQIFINDEFYEKQRDNWLHTNDLVMVQSGHVGHTAVITEELNNTAAHALIIFSNYLEEADPHFINFLLQSHKSKKKLSEITTGNTIKHILASEMKSFSIDLPEYNEQLKIGEFFKKLDKTIELHEKELEALKETKKAFLQKMFV